MVESLLQTASTIDLKDAFKRRLEFTGWKEEHSRHYAQTYLLRTSPAVIPVDDLCPRVTYRDLIKIENFQIDRLKSVTYRIDVSGLGTEDLASQFDKHI